MIRPQSLAGLVAGALIAAPPTDLGGQGTPSAAPPRLVVMVTVDGLKADHLNKFGPQLTGGLARLRDKGAWFTNAHQDHAITETAPGHASILSGRFPRSTGIAANRVGVGDANHPLLGSSGAPGASPERFQGSALFDWLDSKDSRARALSVSAKDRGAILPVGRARESVFWYPGDGDFTTSRYYSDTLPAWVQRFNSRRLGQSYAGKSWTLLLPEAAYTEPDSVELEGGGQNFLFPQPMPADPDQAANWVRATPFIDEMVVAFALEGIEAMQLGRGPHTDLLAVSLSATDAVSHRLGPDSREAHDQLLRTDRIIGVFLDSLFQLRDAGSVVVVLTADHGFSSIPELAAATVKPPPTRATLAPALAAARRRMTQLRVDSTALDVDQQIVLMDRAAFTRARVDPDIVLRVFEDEARKIPGVQRIDRLQELARTGRSDPVSRRWLHQFGTGTNVELVATLTPGSLWQPGPLASHGSPYDSDSHVPIMLLGPGIKPGRYAEFARTVDIAPTLARLLGITPSEKLDGILLRAALIAP